MIGDGVREACQLWRDIAGHAYPLGGSLELNFLADPNAPTATEFYTDKQRIYVCIHRPQEVEEDWLSRIVPLYRESVARIYPGSGTPDDADLARHLWIDTLLFILFHELYHPLVCPNSSTDEKAISLALYRGIRSRFPARSDVEAMHNVDQVKNLVWDLIVNVTYLARLGGVVPDPLPEACAGTLKRSGRRLGSVPIRLPPVAVVPSLYCLSAIKATTDALICVMGSLYAWLSAPDPDLRDRQLAVFRAEGRRLRCPAHPEELALDLLGQLGFRQELAFLRSADAQVLQLGQREVLRGLMMLFDHPRRRYEALETVGAFVAPFLQGAGRQGSIDPHTRGHRGLPQNGQPTDGAADTLQDLMEMLPEQEADDLARNAARPGQGGDGGGDDGQSSQAWTPLTLAAADEFYRRHAVPLTFHSPDARAVALDRGKQKQWRLRSSQTLTSPEVSQLDLERVLTFQTATGLPVLLGLVEGYYQLNQFHLRETPIRSYVLQAGGIEVPDNWVLLVDSSGSMGSGAYVGSGEKYDILMRVCYGVALGLNSAAALLRRRVQFGVVNFSSSTTFSGMHDFAQVFAQHLHPLKETLLVPQSGGTSLDLDVLRQVEAAQNPGRTIFTLITDGEIDNATEVSEYLAGWAAGNDRSLVFIEIGGESGTGKELRRLAQGQPSISCFAVERVEQIGETLGSILIRWHPR